MPGETDRLSQQTSFREFVSALEGVVVWAGDEEGFDFISGGYEDIWGRPVEEVREDHTALLDGVHPDDIDRVVEAMEDEDDRLKRGQSTKFEHRVVRPDGEVRWVEVRTIPIHDEAGDLMEVVGVTVDITERKRAEFDLRRRTERLEQFASVVSHDLRNPLNVAQGRLELVRDELDAADAAPDVEDGLAAVADAHRRMETIIDDMLWLAREGRDIGERSAVDLDSVVRNAWRQVDTADATLAADCSRTVCADEDRLQQVFENLFRNSVEHGSTSNRTQSGDNVEHAGADVTVRVGLLDDGFYVADDGPGIPSARRDQALEPGYSTADDGTGFGLALVETVTAAHDWNLAITESDAGGARFEFRGVDA